MGMTDTPHKLVQDLIDKTLAVGVINVEIAIARAANDTETVERAKKVHADKSNEIVILANKIVSRMRDDV